MFFYISNIFPFQILLSQVRQGNLQQISHSSLQDHRQILPLLLSHFKYYLWSPMLVYIYILSSPAHGFTKFPNSHCSTGSCMTESWKMESNPGCHFQAGPTHTAELHPQPLLPSAGQRESAPCTYGMATLPDFTPEQLGQRGASANPFWAALAQESNMCYGTRLWVATVLDLP